jgi:hypothetical protein
MTLYEPPHDIRHRQAVGGGVVFGPWPPLRRPLAGEYLTE